LEKARTYPEKLWCALAQGRLIEERLMKTNLDPVVGLPHTQIPQIPSGAGALCLPAQGRTRAVSALLPR
jgi:hypothetical protein